MSPHPPSLGSEYRQLLRTLSKVLNVLFSIFGAGGAAYAAATSTGWARSEGLVLAIVVAVVVGVAELGLWLIYARRGAVRRVEEGQRRVRENTGSARLPGTEAVPLELEENAQDDEARVLAELGEDAAPIPPPKTNIRLRRRAIGAKDEN
jgi:hypothetical protein